MALDWGGVKEAGSEIRECGRLRGYFRCEMA